MQRDSAVRLHSLESISREYTSRLVEEINDILIERGLISMSDLLRQFDLPTEYLQSIVSNRIINSATNGVKFESGTLYTDNYVRLQQNMLIGYLQGAFLPVRVSEIGKNIRINEALVQSKRSRTIERDVTLLFRFDSASHS